MKSIITFILDLIVKLRKPALILLLLYLGSEFYWWYQVDYKPYRGKKFDKETWMDASERLAYSDKCSMYTDLVTNHLKIGMQTEEVDKLIGKEWPIYCLDKKIKCYRYWLGNAYVTWLGRPYDAWLDICFNRKGEVIEVGKEDTYERVCAHKTMHCFPAYKPCRCYFRKNQKQPEECPLGIERW